MAVRLEGDEEVRALLKKIPDALFMDAKTSMARTLLSIQTDVTRRFNGDPSSTLQTRTGNLQRSFRVVSRGTSLDNLQSAIFTDSPYAPIHEEGGTIKARRAFRNLEGGPYLAIPSDLNRTQAGVTRFSPRDAFTIGAEIRRIRSPRRADYMILDEDLGPLFWLVKEVDIKARLGFGKIADDKIPFLIQQLDNILLEDLS